MPSYNDKLAADYMKKKKAGPPRTVPVTDPADPNSPQASLYNAAKALTREPMTPGTVPQPMKSKTGVPLDPASGDSPQSVLYNAVNRLYTQEPPTPGTRPKPMPYRVPADPASGDSPQASLYNAVKNLYTREPPTPGITPQPKPYGAPADPADPNSLQGRAASWIIKQFSDPTQPQPPAGTSDVQSPAANRTSTIGYRPSVAPPGGYAAGLMREAPPLDFGRLAKEKSEKEAALINEYAAKNPAAPMLKMEPTIAESQMPLRPDAQQAPARLSDAQLPRSTEDDRPAPPIAGVQLRNVTLTPEQIASRRAAVEREMMQRNFIRNKQTPFAKRDPITGEVDPELQAMWFKNDEKFAADRAYALGQPQRLGTAAAGRQTDLETLAELKRQREAEANRTFSPITEQPSFNAAVQYRDPALQEEAFKKAQDEYGATAHRSVAESQARIADLDRRIAEYIDRTTQPLPENPTPSPLAAADRAARRDIYATEAGKMGEKVTEQQAYAKQLDSERRAAAIRGEQLRNREDPQQELARAMVGTEIDKIKSGRVPEEYKRGLESAATSPEGLANLGAQTIEGIFQSVSNNGSVTGTGITGDAKNALGLSRMLRDQVVGNLEKLRSNPTARANALAFKNQLETKLGVSGEFKADTSFFTSVIDRLLGLGNPMASGPSALTQPERQELAATLNDIYKRLSDLASEQQ